MCPPGRPVVFALPVWIEIDVSREEFLMNPKDFYLSKPWLKHYATGVPTAIEIPDISVPELFSNVAQKYGNKTALIFYGKKITYRDLKDSVDRMATALADMGVRKGDTVALYLLNSPQYVISYFASLSLGAKVTPISPVYTSIEVKHQIEDSEANTAICQDILYDNLDKAGVHLERIILTSVGEYLPALRKLFGKGSQAKVNDGKAAPLADRTSEGRHADPSQSRRRTVPDTGILAYLRRGERSRYCLSPLLPHLRPGCSYVWGISFRVNPGFVYNPGS
jgi:hypothetical protein